MAKIGMILRLAGLNYRRWITNPRYYIIGILCIIWVHFVVGSLSTLTSAFSVQATPWVFPFVFMHRYTPMLIMLGACFLFADAPYMHTGTPYEVIRAGKRTWVRAQIFYTLFTAFLLVAFLFVISVLCILPNLQFSGEWGKVYSTLAQTNAAEEYGVNLRVSYDVLLAYSPIQATLITFFVVGLEIAFLGMLIFTISLAASRTIAMFSGLLFSLLPYVLVAAGTPVMYFFVPTAWSDLSLFVPSNTFGYPSLVYVIIFLILSIVILAVISYKIAPTKETKVLLPV